MRSLVNGEISKVLEVSNLLEEPNIKYYKTGKFTGFCSTDENTDKALKYYRNRNVFLDCNVKHSSNIKDLIQAGDIVIYTINCKIADIDIVKEHTDSRTLKKTLRVGLWSLEQVNIKQILTKEQFERESYRVEE